MQPTVRQGFNSSTLPEATEQLSNSNRAAGNAKGRFEQILAKPASLSGGSGSESLLTILSGAFPKILNRGEALDILQRDFNVFDSRHMRRKPDGKVSVADLQAIADSPGTMFTPEQKAAARYFLSHKGEFELLETAATGGKPDGVFHRADVWAAATLVETGLGAEIDVLASKSPTLRDKLQQAQAEGYTIRYGEAGKGTYMSRETKEIVFDPASKENTGFMVQALAHELGHATYKLEPYVPPDGLSRQEYIDVNLKRHLNDEAEAFMVSLEVRKEILANGGEDIGLSANEADTYREIYKYGMSIMGRDGVREAIGKLWGKSENPSTNPSVTYEQYYSQPYADFYDSLQEAAT